MTQRDKVAPAFLENRKAFRPTCRSVTQLLSHLSKSNSACKSPKHYNAAWRLAYLIRLQDRKFTRNPILSESPACPTLLECKLVSFHKSRCKKIITVSMIACPFISATVWGGRSADLQCRMNLCQEAQHGITPTRRTALPVLPTCS